MKRSRLNLFKVTSMTISLLGILLIIGTIVLFGYLAVSGVSSKVTSNVDTGSAYDQQAALKSEYSTLSTQFKTVKTQVYKSGNKKVKSDYVSAETQLVSAQQAISDVDSALATNQPQSVINDRLNTATTLLQNAKTGLDKVRGEL